MSIGAQGGQGASGGGSVFAHPVWTRWGAHLAFWLMYLFIRSAAAGADPPDDMHDFPYLANRVLVVATYFVLTGILLALIAGIRADKSNWVRNLGLVLGALALGPVTQYAEEFWPMVLAGFAPEGYPFVIYLFQFGWALPLWGLTQALLGYHFETMAQERAVARAQALAYDAQLKMLHYQINPHFLFNTLNSLSALVLTGKSAAAEQMIQTLSVFYRRSLTSDPTGDVSLEEEIGLQKLYLEIEAVRFPERLRPAFEVPLALADALVPGMILQPLVENSIKYAVAASRTPVTVTIAARAEGDMLVLSVSDDGPCTEPGGATQDGCGIGLANVRDRLRARFDGAASIEAGPQLDGGFRTVIRLPLLRRGHDRDPAHPDR